LHAARRLWTRIRSSLWFVPLSVVVGMLALAATLIFADLRLGDQWIGRRSLLFGVGASGARGMLSAIAGSMMTVASLTFSLTISTLATASSQYTSRLVRNFTQDRLNQFILGYFVGLFGYCLVVLRTVRSGGEDGGGFVPSISVMGGLLLALASIGVLIAFIHHIAASIQVATILQRITAQTLDAIDALFPDDLGRPAPAPRGAPAHTLADDDLPAGCRWHAVPAGRFGYVQAVDGQKLIEIADERRAIVRMSADVGAFVTPAGPLCEVALPPSSPAPPDDALAADLRAAFDLGPVRTIEQDAAFGIRQIVDIALRALSPGSNDTTTGVMCIDHLAAILERLATRDIPARLRARDGAVRVIAAARSFDALAALGLDQVRRAAAGNTAILDALLRAIAAAARHTTDPARRRTLARPASLTTDLARDSIDTREDLEPLQLRAAALIADLNAPAEHPAPK
jgi:uncharacterized membrane protein